MATEYRQSTIAEMVESERLMVLEAHERYPRYYSHAEEATIFLSNPLKSIDRDRWIFGAFLSQVKKHHSLALFSTVRLHRIQAMMDLRQALEAGAAAAFAIANPEHEHFVDEDEHGVLHPTKGLSNKRYSWLEEHYPDDSNAIKAMKDHINGWMAHANLVFADNTFRVNAKNRSFDAPFFDFEDEYFVKVDLCFIGNVAVGLLRLFFRVNEGRDVVKFAQDFGPRVDKLAQANQSLIAEMKSSERYKKIQDFLDGQSGKD